MLFNRGFLYTGYPVIRRWQYCGDNIRESPTLRKRERKRINVL